MAKTAAEITEKTLNDLFSPDLILPEQFYRPATVAGQCGERALQWAVLADGIDCYRRLAHSRSRAAQREFAQVKCWVMRNDWSFLYSFVNLCSTFGFEPSAVRLALARYERLEEPASRRRRFRHAA